MLDGFLNPFPTYIFESGFLTKLGAHQLVLDRLVNKCLGFLSLLLRAGFLQASSYLAFMWGLRLELSASHLHGGPLQIEPSHWASLYIIEKWKSVPGGEGMCPKFLQESGAVLTPEKLGPYSFSLPSLPEAPQHFSWMC